MRRQTLGFILIPVLVTVALVFGVLSIYLRIGGTPLSTWIDAPLHDAFVRLRNDLDSDQPISTDVTLIGIDDFTHQKLGVYGRGDWLTRKPFTDQLPYFQQVFQPKVLAYDIIFKDVRGAERVVDPDNFDYDSLPEFFLGVGKRFQTRQFALDSESQAKLMDILYLAGDTALQLGLLMLEPGDETGTADILAYYIPENQTRRWSPEHIIGDPEDPDEDYGTRTPYLRDMRLPLEHVHNIPADYAFAEYAEMPGLSFLDTASIGCISVPRDHDGSVRRVPLVYGIQYAFEDPETGEELRRRFFVPGLSLLAILYYWDIHLGELHGDEAFVGENGKPVVEVFLGKYILVRRPDGSEARIPIDRQGRLQLDFVGKLDAFQSISFARVVEKPLDEALVDGEVTVDPRLYDRLHRRLVFVGHTATGASDVGPCPVDTNTPLVHVHMVAASNILTNTYIRPVHHAGTWLILVILYLVFLPLALRFGPLRLTLITAVLAIGYLLTVYGFIHAHAWILPVSPAVFFLALALLSAVLFYYFVEEKEKRKVRAMFSTTVSPEVLNYMEEHPESFSLAGEKREATMFFSDVAGFTTISESLEPEQLVELLNAYLSPMTEIILRTQGFVDKYEGDAIMAEWGVPYPIPDHARLACFAALEQQETLARLRPELKERFGHEINVRMGLNSGIVSAGYMGSSSRMSYTVMGDAVNQAARFEPANKDYNTLIMIGESTYELALDHIEARLLDRIVVKGKTEPIQIYELIARKGEIDADQRQLIILYEDALRRHWARDWDAAEDCLREALELFSDDGPSQTLMRRIGEYRLTPPPDKWKGEYVRKTKD